MDQRLIDENNRRIREENNRSIEQQNKKDMDFSGEAVGGLAGCLIGLLGIILAIIFYILKYVFIFIVFLRNRFFIKWNWYVKLENFTCFIINIIKISLSLCLFFIFYTFYKLWVIMVSAYIYFVY
ncbi:hypothetical protein DMB95_09345 [Campylobacter sp. MIT 12-8780]|uniref:hypothetical protein n=1 Tax=unclassified Campylobacter TaxID=2593542 RepID=UPI0010F9BC89|nr:MULTISPECIES: hypothetical protein [unclassified Campylobacter]NDJ28046.1 hypothetical protein [Campylobacter sp. MIT 19-121]TKX28273.1 hypothetical protein CQA38_08485 [Campylobacter sp. MIT 12-5580]TQR39985.1 hypothetical protein DMB95_09345 [Campylobacter sp. MIT 12-8780]